MDNINKKTLAIGIDGLPFSLLQNFMAQGHLPEFKKILEGGFKMRQMDASIPDVSSTSWTSFMTGVNPGEHGIFGFMDLRPNSYKMFFPNSGDVKAPTIWEILGQTVDGKSSTLYGQYRAKQGKPLRSVIMNIPQTYPAGTLNGLLTAGFVCPDFRKGTYPESLFNYLKSIEYIPDVDVSKAVGKQDEFFDEVFLALEKREQAYEHLIANESWDLFIGVITETDRLHHFFFDAVVNPNHQRHDKLISFYHKLDKMVGRIFSRFMEMTKGKGMFLTMSDHGFCPIKQEVNLNAWFREKGLLKLNPQGEYFDQIDYGTKVFAMDPARIYVNLKDKYPRGAVDPSDKKQLLDDLKNDLMSLADKEGRPVVKAIYENEELYKGPVSGSGPDLICLGHEGFDLKGALKRDEVFGRGVFTGMHTRHDAHCVIPEAIPMPERPHIEDLAGIMIF